MSNKKLPPYYDDPELKAFIDDPNNEGFLHYLLNRDKEPLTEDEVAELEKTIRQVMQKHRGELDDTIELEVLPIHRGNDREMILIHQLSAKYNRTQANTTFVRAPKEYPEFEEYGLGMPKYLGLTEDEYYSLDLFKIIPLIEAKRKRYHVQPSGAMTRSLSLALMQGTAGRDPRSTKDTDYITTTDRLGNKTIQVKRKYVLDAEPYSLGIRGYEKLISKRDDTTIKLFNLILSHSNDQNNPSMIQLPLSTLVDYGIYGNLDSARKAVKLSIPKLQSLALEGSVGYGKGKQGFTSSVLFPNIDIPTRSGTVVVTANPRIPLGKLASHFALFPKWGYGLSGRAYALLNYIVTQGIISPSKDHIAKGGAFNINLEHASQQMGLPHADDVRNTTRDIIKPLLDAIEEIETAQHNAGMRDIYLTPDYAGIYEGETPGIKDFYRGYIRIDYKGTLLEYSNERTRRITKSKNRHRKAQAKKLKRATKNSRIRS